MTLRSLPLQTALAFSIGSPANEVEELSGLEGALVAVELELAEWKSKRSKLHPFGSA